MTRPIRMETGNYIGVLGTPKVVTPKPRLLPPDVVELKPVIPQIPANNMINRIGRVMSKLFKAV